MLLVRLPTRVRCLSLAAAVAVSGAVVLAAAPLAAAVTPVACEQAALQTAINGATAGEVLQLPAGPCEVNLTVANPAPFTLEGTSPGTTLEPKSVSTSTPIIKAQSGGVSFTLTGLTFSGMNGESESAIFITDPAEAVTISGDTFTDNSAEFGAAVYIYSETATATKPTVIHDNTFGAIGAGNSAYSGGAVFFGSAAPLEVTGNTFLANSATKGNDGFGGALEVAFILPSSTTNPVTISGNTFGGTAPGADNVAGSSGGAALVELAHGQQLTLEGNSFIGNAIVGDKTVNEPRTGAGLALVHHFEDSGFEVAQAHNLFSGNVIEATAENGATGLPAGGAGEWVFGDTVHSVADRFEGNQVTVNDGLPSRPPEGGGLGVLGAEKEGEVPAQPGVFIGADDLFSSNSVAPGGWGGAIYSGYPLTYCKGECPGSSITLQDSTVVDNSVEAGEGSEGGGLWGSPTDKLAIQNSIISGNAPAPQIYGFGGSAAFAYSDVCNEPGGPSVSGEGVICTNPLLNGLGEETLASPTIDTGSNALVPAGLSTDLAGAPRITATRLGCSGLEPAIVDMGAFESQQVGPVPPCPLLKVTTTPTPPVLGDASQSNRSWREGTRLASFSRKRKLPPLGTTFSFTLNEPASVRFAFTQRVGGRKVKGKCVAQTKKNHHEHACKRTVIRGVLSFTGHDGTNKVSFQGRISHSKKLPPGTYTLVITATNATGQHSAREQLTFTILK